MASTGTPEPGNVKHIDGLKFGIVATEWNSHIINKLLDGATSVLKATGYADEDIKVYHVPGTVELTFAAQQLVKSGAVDAVIVLGCVIRGDTPHFDYVCQSVTQGISYLNSTEKIPVVFGVLTVENEEQALERAGGRLGNKGKEFAECAIKMCDFILQIKK